MTNKVGIGIEAQFDSGSLEQQINALGQKIAQVNKVRFTPFTNTTKADIDKILRQFEQLRKIHGELNKRMAATGQSGAGLLNMDWDKLYVDPGVRARQMRKVFEYTTGATFSSVPQASAPSGPPRHTGGGTGGGGGGSAVGGIVTQVAQAGLRAAGPAGGVAAGALGTGMSAGFGAGLMGLMGGMLALGVGKLVSSVMEKVGDAEANAVAMDRLKRTLGDVNVSFDALKAVVNGGAENLKITYAEAGQLAQQFVKLGNVTSAQYKTLAGELDVGVGMSRAFGLDPSQGMGVLGQMRGMGITSNTQESRRFALLIGETIGRSGAFAKADEVMDAIAGFATAQTRNNMGAANVADYAGMFSGMVASGIPGMDPAGAAGLLSKVNSSLSAGGAKGEASQFFTALVGNDMGLDPIQTQILREGGAFATNDSMFGEGSAARRFGIGGPSGGQTFLQASIDRMRRQYGGNKGLMAQATANHLGIGINQAMGLLSVDPQQIGEMQKYGDLGKISGSGIGNLAKVLYGSGSERHAVASGLMGRDDVSQVDKDAIADAMKKDEATQKEVLARLTAQYDQERTTGSDIRDSKNALDNIKTSIADKLVPVMNEMRHGIMYMAGVKDGKTPSQIMRDVIDAESKGRAGAIEGKFKGELDALNERKGYLTNKRNSLDSTNLYFTYRDKPDALAAKLKEQADVARELVEVEGKIHKLESEKAGLLEKENERRAAEIKRMEKDAEARAMGDIAPAALGSVALSGSDHKFGGSPSGVGSGGKSYRSGRGSLDTSSVDAKLAAADAANGLPRGTMKSIMEQEIGGRQDLLNDPTKYHYGLNAQGKRIAGHTGKVSTAFGPFGILESTARKPGYGVRPLQNKSIDEQIRFVSEYFAARKRAAGSLEGGLAGYGEGPAYSASVMRRIKRNAGTPLPEKVPTKSGGDQRFIFDAQPLEIIHRNPNGDLLRAERLSTRVRPASPFGTEMVV